MLKFSVEPALPVLMDDAQLDALAAGGVRYLSVPCGFFDWPEAAVKERVRAITSRGMTIDTCHTPYGGGNKQHSACAESDETRGQTVAMWKHYLERFSLAGVRAAPLHTGGCMRKDVPLCHRERLTETLLALLPSAKASGTTIALENTFYINPPPFAGFGEEPLEDTRWLNDQCDVIRQYVDEFDDPSIQICMDAGHSNFLKHDVMADYRAMKGKIVLFHLHDNDGILDRHYMPGLGCLPFIPLADALRDEGYNEPMFLEVLGDPDGGRKARLQYLPLLLDVLNAGKRAMGC